MTARPRKRITEKGFTLVEVILTIIAAGVLAAFFVQFMGTSLTGAAVTAERVRGEAAAQAAAERIIADWVAEVNANPGGALATITGNIDGNLYDLDTHGIDVAWDYVDFDPTSGDELIMSPTPRTTIKVRVSAPGYDRVFLLGEVRTAADQPLVRY